jgi:hypothetical protein
LVVTAASKPSRKAAPWGQVTERHAADVIVIGGGVLAASAAYALSRRGKKAGNTARACMQAQAHACDCAPHTHSPSPAPWLSPSPLPRPLCTRACAGHPAARLWRPGAAAGARGPPPAIPAQHERAADWVGVSGEAQDFVPEQGLTQGLGVVCWRRGVGVGGACCTLLEPAEPPSRGGPHRKLESPTEEAARGQAHTQDLPRVVHTRAAHTAPSLTEREKEFVADPPHTHAHTRTTTTTPVSASSPPRTGAASRSSSVSSARCSSSAPRSTRPTCSSGAQRRRRGVCRCRGHLRTRWRRFR